MCKLLCLVVLFYCYVVCESKALSKQDTYIEIVQYGKKNLHVNKRSIDVYFDDGDDVSVTFIKPSGLSGSLAMPSMELSLVKGSDRQLLHTAKTFILYFHEKINREFDGWTLTCDIEQNKTKIKLEVHLIKNKGESESRSFGNNMFTIILISLVSFVVISILAMIIISVYSCFKKKNNNPINPDDIEFVPTNKQAECKETEGVDNPEHITKEEHANK